MTKCRDNDTVMALLRKARSVLSDSDEYSGQVPHDQDFIIMGRKEEADC